MKRTQIKYLMPRLAVTLMELLVVLLIISILATVATGVYTGEVRRARIAATRDLIRQIEIAVTRYEVDLGQLPPSGSGTTFPPVEISAGNAGGRRDGSGYLLLALNHSLSGSAFQPASSLWKGPYLNVQSDQFKALNDVETPGNYDILDAFGTPVIYVRSEDYAIDNGTFTGGTQLFASEIPNANPDLPAPNPHLALGETYYNPTTYQVISYGPNGKTLEVTVGGVGSVPFKGAEEDDLNNFGY